MIWWLLNMLRLFKCFNCQEHHWLELILWSSKHWFYENVGQTRSPNYIYVPVQLSKKRSSFYLLISCENICDLDLITHHYCLSYKSTWEPGRKRGEGSFFNPEFTSWWTSPCSPGVRSPLCQSRVLRKAWYSSSWRSHTPGATEPKKPHHQLVPQELRSHSYGAHAARLLKPRFLRSHVQ